jgi:MFS transporter, MHS family, shikimate and dehydroshikimate transport protein
MPPESDKAFRRVVWASFIGTVIEWYDFYLYGTAAALILNKLFFPTFDPLSGQLAAFATFAVGFFARPFGGMIFGHYGDRLGRKSMLVLTLVLMGISTFLIGALPTYNQIGVAAPIALVILRFVQGFAVGGEWGGAVLMVVEHGHQRGRGFYGSLSQSGTAVGLLLSMGVFSVFSQLPEASFMSWGWRVPFLLGIVLMLVGFLIRMHVEESPLFRAAQRQKTPKKEWPLFEAIRSSPRSLIVILGARIAENSCSYVLTVFLLSYATEQLGHARSAVLHAIMTASALGIISIPLLGAVSDRVGRRAVYLCGAALMAFSAFPFFWLLENRQLWSVYVVLIGGFSVGVCAMFAPQAAFFSELFPTNVRYSGASASYQLAAAFGGGLAPMIATQLLQASGGKTWSISLYLVVLSVIGATAVFLARETSRNDLTTGLRSNLSAGEEVREVAEA